MDAQKGPARHTLGSGPEGMVRRLLPHQIAGYSRFVAAAKRLLPVVAGVLIALVALWPHITRKDGRFRIGISTLQESGAEAPTMINPRYVGTDSENRPFSVTADLARNLALNSTSVDLEMPKADITMEDGTWLVLTAREGHFEREAKVLNLAGSVNLFHDTGYEIRTTKVRVDLEEGKATGPEPVEGQGPFGDLKGEGFELFGRGTIIVLTGKSKVTIYPGIRDDAK